jgi:hypothetical protein
MFDPNSAWIPGKFPPTGQTEKYLTANTANTYNATYLRVKSLQVGYTFRNGAFKHIGVHAFRVFANAYDLFTFTGKGLNFVDPEYTDSRLYSYNYPITMNVNIGAQITF